MLFRAAILKGRQPLVLTNPLIRPAQTSAAAVQEGPERDLVNFPRPVRLEQSPVRLGIVPESWFQFFYKKTGVTGPYVFGTGLITYLCSKEWYVMEHEYYTGISIVIMIVYITKKFGPALGKFLDKEVDNYENSFSQGRQDQIDAYENAVKEEEQAQKSAEGQELLIKAKRENVALQLEAVYRERLMAVYREIKRRLDYQVERNNIDRRIAHKHMVQWVVSKVLSSITPEQEKENLNKCLADLQALAVKR